jgi:hypothetical protein
VKLDIVDFLDSYDISYRTEGKNVAKGNVNVRCPFCADDPSFHMGIHLDSLAWSCWRDSTHRGRRPHRLLSRLTGLHFDQISEILGIKEKSQFINEFDGLLEILEGSAVQEESEKKKIRLYPDFVKIKDYGTTERFWKYIRSRKFKEDDIFDVITSFGLRGCLSGDFRGRLIIPVYVDGELMTWTGRHISKRADLRYKSLNKEESRQNIKDCVFNFDSAFNDRGEILYIVEGPLDCMKMDFYLRGRNCRCVGLFNMSVTDAQLVLLSELRENYRLFHVLLDQGELASSTTLLSKLAFLGNVQLATLPGTVKDPGELTPREVVKHFARRA